MMKRRYNRRQVVKELSEVARKPELLAHDYRSSSYGEGVAAGARYAIALLKGGEDCEDC